MNPDIDMGMADKNELADVTTHIFIGFRDFGSKKNRIDWCEGISRGISIELELSAAAWG